MKKWTTSENANCHWLDLADSVNWTRDFKLPGKIEWNMAVNALETALDDMQREFQRTRIWRQLS